MPDAFISMITSFSEGVGSSKFSSTTVLFPGNTAPSITYSSRKKGVMLAVHGIDKFLYWLNVYLIRIGVFSK